MLSLTLPAGQHHVVRDGPAMGYRTVFPRTAVGHSSWPVGHSP